MGCGEPTLRFPSAGDWQWRSSFPLRTSATTGSTKPSGSGKVSSTKREAQPATKATYADTTNLASKYVAFPLFLGDSAKGSSRVTRRLQIINPQIHVYEGKSPRSRNCNKKGGFFGFMSSVLLQYEQRESADFFVEVDPCS